MSDLPRFFVSPEDVKGGMVTIRGRDARHILRSLRRGKGDALVVTAGLGVEYDATIISTAPRVVQARIEGERRVDTEATIEITIAQGMPKGSKMEFVVQKCTEVGVKRIIPARTARSVVEYRAERMGPRMARWIRIAEEAAKQAGRTQVPTVAPVADFPAAVAELSGMDLAILPWEEERGVTLRETLRRGPRPTRVGVFIGPEGGFSPVEVEAAARAGMVSVTLGPRVLRTETAGAVVAALILYEFGEMG